MIKDANAGTASDSSKFYEAFAISVLTNPNLTLVEQDAGKLSSEINLDRLASAIIHIYAQDTIKSASKTDLLWLLAHFVALYRSWSVESSHQVHIKALYVQLSGLESEIRLRLAIDTTAQPTAKGSDEMDLDEALLEPLPPYVASQLSSLVDREGLAQVLRALAR